MHADRWSSTVWFVALAIDIALCVYFCLSVAWNPPRPPPGPAHAEVPLANEKRCGRPYLNRLLAAVDSLELELWTLVDERAEATDQLTKQALEIQLDDTNDRLHRIHAAYTGCDQRRQLQARPVKPTCNHANCY